MSLPSKAVAFLTLFLAVGQGDADDRGHLPERDVTGARDEAVEAPPAQESGATHTSDVSQTLLADVLDTLKEKKMPREARAPRGPSKTGFDRWLEKFEKDPSLGGRMHFTYRADYRAQVFDHDDLNFLFPEEVEAVDRQFAAELRERHRNNRDQDFDQYVALRLNRLFRSYSNSTFQGADFDFSGRYFKDVDGTASGNESLDGFDRLSGRDDFQLRTLNTRLSLAEKRVLLTLGRQTIASAEWVHLDGGRVLARGLGLFERPVEIEAFAGSRVSYYSTIDQSFIAGGAVRYFPTEATRLELSNVHYLENSLQAEAFQRFGPSVDGLLRFRMINEDAESVQLETGYNNLDLGLELDLSYYGKFGLNADDFNFDYTFVERSRKDDDHDYRFNIGDIKPFDEITLEGRKEIVPDLGVLLGGTGHWLRSGSPDVYNSDWYEVWVGADTLHFPFEGLTACVILRYRDTDLPTRTIRSRGTPELFTDVISDGEPQFLGVELTLEQEFAGRISVGTLFEYRHFDFEGRFLDISGLHAVGTTVYGRYRQSEILSYYLAYSFERDLQDVTSSPDFDHLHAVHARFEVSW